MEKSWWKKVDETFKIIKWMNIKEIKEMDSGVLSGEQWMRTFGGL